MPFPRALGSSWASSRTRLTPWLVSTASQSHPNRFSNVARPGVTQTRTNADDGRLDLPRLDQKWRQKWAALKSHDGGEGRRNEYILPMFPYPSGTLHLGHLRVYTVADVMARLRRLQGRQVLFPMGWDAFGLPAENAALERGVDPASWTKRNIQKMKDQLDVMNGSWDWKREICTCDPDFYEHTQKLFLMLYEKGLAYRAEAEVNYDPVEMTVLANEQVDAEGRSWRSGAKVEKKKLKQWFFKITAFREELLQNLESLERDGAWPERVLAMQKNWLGKSAGVMIKFPVMAAGHDIHSAIEVFTTRPDTLFGVQYIALASTHPVVSQLAGSDAELQAFLDTLPGLPEDSKVGYMLPHVRAVNPLAYNESSPDATKESIPVYIAPYVLGDYGEGAVMGVPAHDHRDHAFWKEHRYDEPVRVVLAASEDESTTVMLNEPFVEHGVMTANSGPFKGKSSVEASRMLVVMLEAAKLGKPVEKWRLRDWLISRQRYWGTPIPVVHCKSCGPVPVPEAELPVVLPSVDGHWGSGRTGNPLEAAEEWIKTECPTCNGPAKRDTDTMDTFVDSSWYYARFADPENRDALFSLTAAEQALPVDLYIGGIEHAILHLLYARFIYKFLNSTDLVPREMQEHSANAEPFTRLITQGMVQGKTYTDAETGRFLRPDEVDFSDAKNPKIKETGASPNVTFEKMSKSKHNGVDPTVFIAKYGADATRAHMIFQAPVGDVLNWDGTKISGITRWFSRLHHLVQNLMSPTGCVGETAKERIIKNLARLDSMSQEEMAEWRSDTELWREVQKTIECVSSAYDDVYSLNTVVSHLMILTNTLLDAEGASMFMKREAASTLLRMMAPITPAFAEECWSMLHGSSPSLFESCTFPEVDGTAAMLRPRALSCAVQVGGKLRAVVEVPVPPEDLAGDALRDWMVGEILKTEAGMAKLSGQQDADIRRAKRVIVVRGGALVNFVV